MPPADDFRRVHERLDTLFESLAEIESAVKTINGRCEPCRKQTDAHQVTLYGNGKTGLVTRMATVEVGRVDTLSVKSVCTLIAAVGALAATIGAAMAAMVK